jgi:phospholipid-binding lipoprotein MlaA
VKPADPGRRTAGRARACAALALAWVLAGCATVPPNAGSNPADPFEKVNRQVYAFNDRFDRAIAKPAAKGYQAVVPKPLRECLGNVFANVGEVGNAINAGLQARPADAATDVGRLLVNSTIGLGGCFDVAKQLGWERNKQDFGLTLGRWGLTPGPYVVIPFLGPSNVRDALGEIPDYFTDPVTYIYPVAASWQVYGVRLVDRRAQYLEASNLMEEAALDPYAFLRDGYLQRRRSRISGESAAPPPPLEEDPDSPDAAPAAPKPAPGPASGPASQPGEAPEH